MTTSPRPLPRLTRPEPGAARVGTFVKIAAPSVIEVLALAGLDFAVLDGEHAPFDRADIDRLVLAGVAAGLPLLVRVSDDAPATLLSVLDIGAAGVVVPHVDTAAQAERIVSRCRLRGGTRGYSGSPRGAGYGTFGMKRVLADADRALVVCQIESPQAVAEAAAIAAVDGVHALFIGRADLALAMGHDDIRTAEVDRAVDLVMAAAGAAGKDVAVAVADARERDVFTARGARWVVVGSDQSLLRQAAVAVARRDEAG